MKRSCITSTASLMTLFVIVILVRAPKVVAQTGQALVIGNQLYFFGKVENAIDDATAVAQELDRLHFKVTLVQDANLAAMKGAVDAFGAVIKGTNDIAVVYFAGHAIQVSGENYMIPSDAQGMEPGEVPDRTVGLQAVYDVMRHHTGPNLIIMDACRSNPFGSLAGNDYVPGLAKPFDYPSGTMIEFSTAPGSVTKDGEGHHSPFTRALLKYMPQPGVPADVIFQQVYQAVQENTDRLQMPSQTSSIANQFALRQPVVVVLHLSSADDDAVVLVNDQEALDWDRDGANEKRVSLREGDNKIEVKVYNQRSYTGGVPGLGGHLPEGWNYSLTVSQSDGHVLVPLSGREDVPADNGPHHGKLFSVATMTVAVKPDTDDIAVVAIDPATWTRDH